MAQGKFVVPLDRERAVIKEGRFGFSFGDIPPSANCYHAWYHRLHEVVAVGALNIRNLDETVKRRLQVRAARHGRSMEAEARAILAEAVREPADSAGLFTTLLDRFGALGGVDLGLPGREEPARAADFSA